MVNQQLLDYVKIELAKGTSRERIRSLLLSNDWTNDDVDQAFRTVVSSEPVAQAADASNLASVNSQPIQSGQPIQTQDKAQAETLSQPQGLSKKTSRSKALIVSLLVALMLFGGVAFAYLGGYMPQLEVLISGNKDPKDLMARLVEVTSFEYSGEMKIEGEADEIAKVGQGFVPTGGSKTSTVVINFAGASDIQNVEDPKGLFTFDIKTDAVSFEEFALGFDIRYISKALYIKVNDMPDLGFIDISSLKGQWIKIDIGAASKKYGFEKEATKSQLSKEQIEKLKVAIVKANVIKFTNKGVAEDVEGVSTKRYTFTLDPEGIKKFLVEVTPIIEKREVTAEELLAFDKSFARSKPILGEIWIGVKDLLPYKITFQAEIGDDKDPSKPAVLTATFIFRNYNKPVNIDVPADARLIEEVLKGLFGANGNI